MADERKLHFANDPQLERVREWWQQHGRPIIGGLSLGLLAVAGFNYWQHHQQTQGEDASILFERLQAEIETAGEAETQAETDAEAATEAEADTDAATDAEVDTATDAEADTASAVQTIAEELMFAYGATPYAAHAAFALAKFAVEDGDLATAARALRWTLNNSKDNTLLHIARLRLASVLLSQDETDEALSMLNEADPEGFVARYDELIGDAYLQKGEVAAAREAYQRSLEQLSPSADEHALLKLKLDNLGG